MKFLSLPKLSFIDYPSRASLIIYTTGCDFKCPGCHARKLAEGNGISEQEVLEFIKTYDNLSWVKGLVICGGEPTINQDLPDFLTRVKKETGLEVKLDTNGNNPEMLSRILKEGLVNYIAMDVKGSPEIYPWVTGIPVDIKRIEKSMTQVSSSKLPYEFRTTLWPIAFGDDLGWMNEQETIEMVDWITRVTGKKEHRHYLQRFVARSKEEMINPKLSKEQLPQEMWKTPDSVTTQVQKVMQAQGYKCEIR
jgi:pyruvate formate lyase activating enzyme